jgi:mannose-1-phosphate guanylyltransferase
MSSHSVEARNGLRGPVKEAPVVAPSVGGARHCWTVILAGGDGTRLQRLTLKIAGDSRPKQFCSILSEMSLLAQTRARLESLFHVDRELFVVTRAHETYYREELRNVDDLRIISQPLNRGTGVAVALALLHILRRDEDAVVVFVPCDHYYSDAKAFGCTVRSALSGVEQNPNSIVIVGAEARYAEPEYGWIEVGAPISEESVPLLRVNRFWEKPSLTQAGTLLRRGCLWNTFVTVGRASTLVDLFCSQVPEVVLSLNEALVGDELDSVYGVMGAVDFSRQILAPQPHRLLAVRDRSSGWADVGSPTRVMDTLAQNNIQPAWLRNGHSLSLSPSASQYQAHQDGVWQDPAG